jgi:hypothetical protein
MPVAGVDGGRGGFLSPWTSSRLCDGVGYPMSKFEMKRTLNNFIRDEGGGLAARWALLMGFAVVVAAYLLGRCR